MGEERWQPPVPSGRVAMLDTFPSWLRTPIIPWFRARLGASWLERFFPAMLVRFQMEMQQDFGFGVQEVYYDLEVTQFLRDCDDATFINLIDYLLVHGEEDDYDPSSEVSDVELLNQLLSDGGSKWTVARVGTEDRVTERVPAGVLNSVQHALTGADAAAQKLQEAWLDAFGTEPRASIAYYTAVVAVENAAFAVIPVKKTEPTLADLFSLLEADTPKWKLILRDNDRAPGGKALAQMLRTLWRGHDSRHGASEYEDVTIEQARAAVMLAATLVWWFRSGVVIPV
ncbi:hypothetical protein WDV91_16460 [Curtobacterium flaccumfaciens pv. flaccumfaciens]